MNSERLGTWLFKNVIPIIIVICILYIISQFKKLSELRKEIQKRFDQVLTEYLNNKIIEAKTTTDSIIKEYGREDEISTEISRLLVTIEKGESGDINDKVKASNALNKFKLKKGIDYERYPALAKISTLGTFNESEMSSLDNGIALARKEYNTYAFRYNQVASGFPIQYITKLFGFKTHYDIFGNPKSTTTVEAEVEEEQNETISLNLLNYSEKKEEQVQNEEAQAKQDEQPEVLIEHTDVIIKPTKNLTNLSEDNKS